MEINFANTIDAELHKRLKKATADRRVTMKIALDQALRAWIDSSYKDPDDELGARLLRMMRTADDPIMKRIASAFIEQAKTWRG